MWAGLLALVAGCASPGKPGLFGATSKPGDQIEPTQVDEFDDIVSIVQFWPQYPWLRENQKTVGFQVRSYFVSGKTEKGEFVPGTIFIWLYEVNPAARGKDAKKLAQVWELDRAASMGFRIRKLAIGGYSYGFVLPWERSLDLAGKTIEVAFGYQRGDGRMVMSKPRQFRAP